MKGREIEKLSTNNRHGESTDDHHAGLVHVTLDGKREFELILEMVSSMTNSTGPFDSNDLDEIQDQLREAWASSKQVGASFSFLAQHNGETVSCDVIGECAEGIHKFYTIIMAQADRYNTDQRTLKDAIEVVLTHLQHARNHEPNEQALHAVEVLRKEGPMSKKEFAQACLEHIKGCDQCAVVSLVQCHPEGAPFRCFECTEEGKKNFSIFSIQPVAASTGRAAKKQHTSRSSEKGEKSREEGQQHPRISAAGGDGPSDDDGSSSDESESSHGKARSKPRAPKKKKDKKEIAESAENEAPIYNPYIRGPHSSAHNVPGEDILREFANLTTRSQEAVDRQNQTVSAEI